MQKSIGVEGRFVGYEGLRGMCKERIKCMSRAYVTDKERSTNGLCRMSKGCITDKANMYRICNGQNVRLNDHRTHLTSQVAASISFVS